MPEINQQVLEKCNCAIENALNSTERGRALEDLICSFFEQIPGITITQRNERNVFNSEEIDVVLWNECEAAGLYFLPDIILVECKNWSVRVGSKEVSWFIEKLRGRGLDFGILVSSEGITGDPDSLTSAHHIISKALPERRRLVVLTLQEILGVKNTDEFSRLIKTKICKLVANGALT